MPAGLGQSRVAPGDHVVLFYSDDDELVESVAGYLCDAVRAGGVALIVATASHRASFEAEMARSGVDVGAARMAGRLVSLDARDTMGRFVVGDRPDPPLFHAVVGDLVREAVEAGGPVHAYGEMVDLLWEAGQVNSAIELEGLWNDLGRELPFSLFCAYRTESLRPDEFDALHQVCGLHSTVLGSSSATPGLAVEAALEAHRTFRPDMRSPGQARKFLVETLQAWGDEDLIADATLVVSEFAANAVTHARTEFTVAVAARRDALRISVIDRSPSHPIDRAPTLAATSGRGLGLVAALATKWGAEDVEDGKVVWAELLRPPVPAAPSTGYP